MDTRNNRGFTLVEMLVVVVIIGVLAGLISAAAIVARTAARRAVLNQELKQLETAIIAYKEKFGDYPPDFTDPNAVKAHLARAFPRYVPQSTSNGLPSQYASLDPSMALVFWLGGVAGADGYPNGFSANPNNPFDMSQSRINNGPFFEFDRKRLQQVSSGLFKYLPPNDNAQSDPYVYFRPNSVSTYMVSATNNQIKQVTVTSSSAGTNAVVRPYQDAQAGGWVNAKSFQILSPGLDGRFQNSGQAAPGINFPLGSDYTPAQFDDMTNFSNGTLESKIP